MCPVTEGAPFSPTYCIGNTPFGINTQNIRVRTFVESVL